MALHLHLFLFVQSFQWGTAIPFLPESKEIIFDRFDGACAGKKIPLWAFNTVSKAEGTFVYVNSTMTATEDIEGKLIVNLNIFRCRSRENLDTCEEFLSHRGLDYCKMLEPSAIMNSPLYVSYKPEYKCPIKKGVYRAYNSKIDVSAVAVFPLGDYYWKTKTEVFNEKHKKMLCFQTEAHAKRKF